MLTPPPISLKLKVVRSGLGVQQIWGIEEANDAIAIYPPLAIFDNDNVKQL